MLGYSSRNSYAVSSFGKHSELYVKNLSVKDVYYQMGYLQHILLGSHLLQHRTYRSLLFIYSKF